MQRGTAHPATGRRTQENLITRLGLVADREVLTQEAIDEYIRLFNKPLPQSHIAAVAAFFGWRVSEHDDALREEMELQPLPAVEE